MNKDALSWGAIFGQMIIQFAPVLILLVITFALSLAFKRRLGLYGKLFDSTVGMIGLRWCCSGFSRRSSPACSTWSPPTTRSTSRR